MSEVIDKESYVKKITGFIFRRFLKIYNSLDFFIICMRCVIKSQLVKDELAHGLCYIFIGHIN